MPGVTAAIVGARNGAQVEGWVAATDLALTVGDLADIGDAIVASGAGAGPVVPARI